MSRILLAALSGLLLFFSSPGSGGHGLLAWVALAPLLLGLRGLGWRPAAGLGLLAGLVYYLPLLHWITIVLGVFGGVHPLVAALALGLLALYMSLYSALFAGLLVVLTDWGASRQSDLMASLPGPFARRRRWGVLWAAPVIWVGLDVLRARLFTGFPWQDLGYSLYQWPLLIQVADLGGHHLITFLIVLGSTLLALLARSALSAARGAWQEHRPTPPSRRSLALALLVLVLAIVYGQFRLQQWPADPATADPTLEVAVAQGNIPQDEKWDYHRQAATVQRYFELSHRSVQRPQGPPALLIWPETALPFYPLEHPLFDQVAAFAARHQLCLLTGAPHRELDRAKDQPRYYNSAMLVGPDRETPQPAGIYRKQHLVPFGEYIPLRRLLPFFAPVVETLGDFTPGPGPELLACRDVRLGTLICFEAIFPRLARQMTNQGAELLVNITNDAWFGDSNAPRQHLSMTVLRAVENRRSLARAANTGISVFITPDGRLHQSTELFTPDLRLASLPLPPPSATSAVLHPFFSPYRLGGFLFGPLCLLLLMAGTIRQIYVTMSR